MPATVTFTEGAAVALARCREALLRRPVVNNLLLTLLSARAASPAPGRYWVVEDGGRFAGLAFQSPLDAPAVISRMAPGHVEQLAAAVHEAGAQLPGVNGEPAASTAFAGDWAALTGATIVPRRAVRLYEARRVREGPRPPGRFRLATSDDRALLLDWTRRFNAEVHAPGGDPERMVDQRLRAGQLWFWDDGGPVAMAGISTPTAGVARVLWVYTPREKRGRGYARACVREVTRQVLNRALRCALYADLGDPVATGIYLRLGYRPVTELMEFRFESAVRR
ncbi:MAG TPA: GNAT family N-acetyltransferase [Candidatus Baltobacteraceae bacterium]|nr:GNAT family N-acetyltransferase [Candidatus Baltobacteraceae bacterium]